jgi:hypothetical protein
LPRVTLDKVLELRMTPPDPGPLQAHGPGG